MNKAYLLIGGNIGDRLNNLQLARTAIDNNIGKIEITSSVYETEAWGNTNQPAFLNQVLLVLTPFNAEDLLHKLLQVELDLGRERKEKMGPRTIDIDILFYNEEIINKPELEVPHPRLGERRFVLTPLVEIAPNLVHPIFGKNMSEMLADCKDNLKVRKFE